jgi:hypothetical protein
MLQSYDTCVINFDDESTAHCFTLKKLFSVYYLMWKYYNLLTLSQSYRVAWLADFYGQRVDSTAQINSALIPPLAAIKARTGTSLGPEGPGYQGANDQLLRLADENVWRSCDMRFPQAVKQHRVQPYIYTYQRHNHDIMNIVISRSRVRHVNLP